MKANENGEALYDFSNQTTVLVTENKSLRGERATIEAIANGFLSEAALQKRSDLTVSDEKQPKKQPKLKIPEFPSKIVEYLKSATNSHAH